jgi:hypothetical protein
VHRGFLPFNVSHSVVVDETWLINSLDGPQICKLIVQQFTKKIKRVAATVFPRYHGSAEPFDRLIAQPDALAHR